MIEFVRVGKRFGTQVVLEEVSFRIHPGERAGIVGPNGAGKSTLFEMICGGCEADEGRVQVRHDARLGYVRQQLHAHAVTVSLLEYTADAVPRLSDIHREMHTLEKQVAGAAGTEREKMLGRLGELAHDYENLGGYEMTTRAEAALSGLGFPVEEHKAPFASFSGGWQMRAELARTLIARPDLLLLDEPSNYLDLPAVEWLQRFLREFSGTMLLVSHDRFLLESLTGITLEVADGQVTRYQGGYSYYARERVERHRQRLAARKNQDRKREHMERFVERFRAKNTKASQVQSRLKALARMEPIRVSLSTPSQAPIYIPAAPHCGTEAIRLEDAGVGYEEGRWVLRKVNLSLRRGDRMALVGYNGMGKTTLLRLLAGILAPREGRRVVGHKVIIGYQSQEFAETMPPDQTVYDIAKALVPDPQKVPLRSILGRFGFTGESVDKPCGVLSGGEKIRLAFARLFVYPPNLLLLDEPTTHLDLRGRETLEEALAAFTGTVCLVSHDLAFVRNVATSILALSPSGLMLYPGGYDYYLEKRTETGQAPAVAVPSDEPDRKSRKRARAEQLQARARRRRQLEKEARSAEESVEALEAEREHLLAALGPGPTGPEIDFETMNRRLQAIQDEIEAVTARWEDAAAALARLDEQEEPA